MRLSLPSIRSRLLWHMGLLFAGGMVALYLAASSYARYAADNSYDRLLAGSALSIAETLSVAQDAVRVDIPYAALDMLTAAPNDRVFYRVIGAAGETVTGYGDLPASERSLRPPSDADPVRFFDAAYRGEPVRFALAGREVRIGGKTGWIWVQVGQTRQARLALARELTIRALLPILLLTVLAGIVVWFSIGRAMRPLERIGQSLSQRQASDLSPITERVPSEIAPLVKAMNDFMARLDNNIAVLRNFIANAAHQLRTPLTALLVQLQAAETTRGKARSDSVAEAGRSASRLARLVDQLLSDALVTHRAEEGRRSGFDLTRTIEQAVHDVVPHTTESDVRYTTALTTAPMIGDEVMVSEAIKNLLHNALTHGENLDGAIEITLAEEAEGYKLTIADNGPGIDEASIEELGGRFRVGASGRGSVGLGVAIVRQVAQSHDGTLHFINRPEGGLKAELWLPRQ